MRLFRNSCLLDCNTSDFIYFDLFRLYYCTCIEFCKMSVTIWPESKRGRRTRYGSAPPGFNHVPQATRNCHRSPVRKMCVHGQIALTMRSKNVRFLTGDGRCVVCDSFVRPATLVRVCDECNYGTNQGRCVICGGPGTADAYYCKECTTTEKDRDGCPKIINLGSAKTDLFYERKKYGLKKR